MYRISTFYNVFLILRDQNSGTDRQVEKFHGWRVHGSETRTDMEIRSKLFSKSVRSRQKCQEWANTRGKHVRALMRVKNAERELKNFAL